MGRGADQDRRAAGVGIMARKKRAPARNAPKNDPDKARLRAAVKRINIENLIKHLEWLGANALNILRPMDERRERLQSYPRICISPALVDTIVAILHLLPQRGRPDLWSDEIKETAIMGLLANRPIWPLAKQIALATGQPAESVRSRLQKMNATLVKEYERTVASPASSCGWESSA